MQDKIKTKLDYMKEADKLEEDAMNYEEWVQNKKKSTKESYFEYYDDIKISIKEDW